MGWTVWSVFVDRSLARMREITAVNVDGAESGTLHPVRHNEANNACDQIQPNWSVIIIAMQARAVLQKF